MKYGIIIFFYFVIHDYIFLTQLYNYR